MNRSGFNYALRYICILVVIIFGFVAIIGSSGSSSGDGDSDGDGNSGGSQSLTVVGISGNQVSLDGTWKSVCNYDSNDDESEMWTIKVSGSTFTQTEDVWFESATCSGLSDATVTMTGTVTLGNEVTVSMNTSDVTATEVDPVISSYVGTINNGDLVADFNTNKRCGYEDWVVDTPKDLMGTECGPDSTEIKDVIHVDDTGASDVWYNGDTEGLQDANGYPAEIDIGSAKTRQ